MWIDERSIDEIKISALKHLDEIEAKPQKTKEQTLKELNSFLAAHKNSKDWRDYKKAKDIMGWVFDYEEYEKLIETILKELKL